MPGMVAPPRTRDPLWLEVRPGVKMHRLVHLAGELTATINAHAWCEDFGDVTLWHGALTRTLKLVELLRVPDGRLFVRVRTDVRPASSIADPGLYPVRDWNELDQFLVLPWLQEVAAPEPAKSCTCELRTLMMSGCRCGGA